MPIPITCNAFRSRRSARRALAGITSVTIATTAADLPVRGIDNKRKVQRYVVGAEGEFDAFGNDRALGYIWSIWPVRASRTAAQHHEYRAHHAERDERSLCAGGQAAGSPPDRSSA